VVLQREWRGLQDRKEKRLVKVLFDRRWAELPPEHAQPEAVEALCDAEKTARRIDTAIQRTLVWARVEGLEGPKFMVRDVRVYAEHDEVKPGWWVTREWVQVLLLEGWRTPERVWTDEEYVEEIEGVQ
jgi:hypothetical protein